MRSERPPVAAASSDAHLAIARVVRLISEVRLAVLVLATVTAWADGTLTSAALVVVVVAVPFSVVPARSWESRGELLSRSGILLACDLVITVLVVILVSGQLMAVYAAATVALLGVVVGTGLALVMAIPLALLLVGDVRAVGVAALVVPVTAAFGVVAMAWAGNTLGQALRAQDTAARELSVARTRRAATMERVRIARDLHDTVAGDLAGARMLSHALADLLEAGGTGGRPLELARQLAQTCATAHTHTREALTELRQAERGASEEIAEAAGRWAERTGLTLGLTVDDAVEAVPDDVLHDLRAILLELLENVRRHAHASRVDVGVAVAEGAVRLVVTDDGRGMDLDAPVPDGHYGLCGIQERVAERSGSVVRTAPRGGGLRTEVVLATGRPARRGAGTEGSAVPLAPPDPAEVSL